MPLQSTLSSELLIRAGIDSVLIIHTCFYSCLLFFLLPVVLGFSFRGLVVDGGMGRWKFFYCLIWMLWGAGMLEKALGQVKVDPEDKGF